MTKKYKTRINVSSLFLPLSCTLYYLHNYSTDFDHLGVNRLVFDQITDLAGQLRPSSYRLVLLTILFTDVVLNAFILEQNVISGLIIVFQRLKFQNSGWH